MREVMKGLACWSVWLLMAAVWVCNRHRREKREKWSRIETDRHECRLQPEAVK